jgi:hypothetical protein
MCEKQGWYIEEKKESFSFNLYLLIAYWYENGQKKEKNAGKNDGFMFLLFDRKRPDKIEIYQTNTDEKQTIIIGNKLGYFKLINGNEKELKKILKDDFKKGRFGKIKYWLGWYWIKDKYFRHQEFFTFLGVFLTIIALAITIFVSVLVKGSNTTIIKKIVTYNY